MNYDFIIGQLKMNAESIASLVRYVSDDQARWKPDANAWSILEVINHLLDEEREDFRVRLDAILFQPVEQWPQIDPEGWVVERQYNNRDLQESLDNYLAERKSSLRWLNALERSDWKQEFSAPFGSIRAGDMLVSWATHDQLHLRQLIELHRAYLELRSEPYRLDYAGQW